MNNEWIIEYWSLARLTWHPVNGKYTGSQAMKVPMAPNTLEFCLDVWKRCYQHNINITLPMRIHNINTNIILPKELLE